MKSIVVRACILFTIFTLGIIIGGHYSKEAVANPHLYVSNTPLMLDGTELDQAQPYEDENVLSEIGKNLATFVTLTIQSFVKWVIQVIP